MRIGLRRVQGRGRRRQCCRGVRQLYPRRCRWQGPGCACAQQRARHAPPRWEQWPCPPRCRHSRLGSACALRGARPEPLMQRLPVPGVLLLMQSLVPGVLRRQAEPRQRVQRPPLRWREWERQRLLRDRQGHRYPLRARGHAHGGRAPRTTGAPARHSPGADHLYRPTHRRPCARGGQDGCSAVCAGMRDENVAMLVPCTGML